MKDVAVSASGNYPSYGVYNDRSSPTMIHMTVSALSMADAYGVYNVAPSGDYTVTIDGSQITASTNTIVNYGGATYVGASKLEGGSVIIGTGTVICAGVYDENYVFHANTCP
jgi:hypothetical protein